MSYHILAEWHEMWWEDGLYETLEAADAAARAKALGKTSGPSFLVVQIHAGYGPGADTP